MRAAAAAALGVLVVSCGGDREPQAIVTAPQVVKSAVHDPCVAAVAAIEAEVRNEGPPPARVLAAWRMFGSSDAVSCAADLRWRAVEAGVASLDDERVLEDHRPTDGKAIVVADVAVDALSRLTAVDLGRRISLGFFDANQHAQEAAANAEVSARWHRWWAATPHDRDAILGPGVRPMLSAIDDERARVSRARAHELRVLRASTLEVQAVHAVARLPPIEDRLVGLTHEREVVYAWPSGGAIHLGALHVGEEIAVPDSLLQRIRFDDPAAFDVMLRDQWLAARFADGDVIARLALRPPPR